MDDDRLPLFVMAAQWLFIAAGEVPHDGRGLGRIHVSTMCQPCVSIRLAGQLRLSQCVMHVVWQQQQQLQQRVAFWRWSANACSLVLLLFAALCCCLHPVMMAGSDGTTRGPIVIGLVASS